MVCSEELQDHTSGNQKTLVSDLEEAVRDEWALLNGVTSLAGSNALNWARG